LSAYEIDSQPSAVKKIMQDVKSAPTEMGPMEEIGYLTLTDFRRLSDNPRSGQAFIAKIIQFAGRIFCSLYGCRRRLSLSPLYTDYIQSVCSSLANRRTLAAVLAGDKKSIQLNEVEALIEMEKEL